MAGEKWTPNPAGRRVLPILGDEIETFEEEVRRFRNGEWDDTEFTRSGFARVSMGNVSPTGRWCG